MKTVW